MTALIPALILLALALGVLPLPLAIQVAGLAAVALTGLLVQRRSRCSLARQLLLWVLLLLAWLWGLQAQPHPGPRDPVRLIPDGHSSSLAVLQGSLLSDPQRSAQDASCRVLLQQDGGSTELLFSSCPPLQQGWRLIRPKIAIERLLMPGAARLLQVDGHQGATAAEPQAAHRLDQHRSVGPWPLIAGRSQGRSQEIGRAHV